MHVSGLTTMHTGPSILWEVFLQLQWCTLCGRGEGGYCGWCVTGAEIEVSTPGIAQES